MPYKDPAVRKAKAKVYSRQSFEKNRQQFRDRWKAWSQTPAGREYQRLRDQVRAPQRQLADLRRKYGLTSEDYFALLTTQKGVCAICGKDNGPRALVVDHDHNTNQVRGLLCDTCNWGIGQFHEDLALFESAVRYLKNSGGNDARR